MPCQRVFMLIKEVHENENIKNALLTKSKQKSDENKKKKKSRLSTRVIISGGTKTYSYLIISMLNIIFSKTVY